MSEDGDLGLKNYALRPRRMESPNMDCIKLERNGKSEGIEVKTQEKRKLKEFLGFSKISVVTKYVKPEVGKRGLENIVAGQRSNDSRVTYSSKITEVAPDNSVNDGGSGIASQEEAVEGVSDLKEESDIASFRRATTMLFFEGEYNGRHVVPIGSRFQAEIPHLESEYVKNTESMGIRRILENHDKSRRRVNKVATFPNGRQTRLAPQGRMI